MPPEQTFEQDWSDFQSLYKAFQAKPQSQRAVKALEGWANTFFKNHTAAHHTLLYRFVKAVSVEDIRVLYNHSKFFSFLNERQFQDLLSQTLYYTSYRHFKEGFDIYQKMATTTHSTLRAEDKQRTLNKLFRASLLNHRAQHLALLLNTPTSVSYSFFQTGLSTWFDALVRKKNWTPLLYLLAEGFITGQEPQLLKVFRSYGPSYQQSYSDFLLKIEEKENLTKALPIVPDSREPKKINKI